MPLLDQAYVAFLGVVIIVIIGIVTEKKKVVWENAFSNTLTFILVLSSVDMGWYITVGMLAYLIIGIIVTLKKVKPAYFLFGFKTYGALSLALLLGSYGYLGLNIMTPTMDGLVRLCMLWAVLAVLINLVGFLYWKLR